VASWTVAVSITWRGVEGITKQFQRVNWDLDEEEFRDDLNVHCGVFSSWLTADSPAFMCVKNKGVQLGALRIERHGVRPWNMIG